jgi:uncharacterized protein YgiB involved in biofilm formation
MAHSYRPHDEMPRKRSRVVLLTMMGVGFGALVLAELWPRGGGTVPAGVFQDVDTCINSGRYDRATCNAAFAEAAKHDVEHAPRFASQADCEADFAPGSCQALPQQPGAAAGSGPSFAPVMAGVLIGGALAAAAGSAGAPAVQPVYRSCSADPQDRCQPAAGTGGGGGYHGGGLYTCSGYRVGSSYGTTRVEPAAFNTVRATTLSRGGFGARARAVSSAS